MTDEQFQKIADQFADHEVRISALEKLLVIKIAGGKPGDGKHKTLREIVKGRKLKNGLEKLAVIVGYHEKLVGSLVKKDDLKKEWQGTKMTGTYKTNLLDDASGVYIRVLPTGECDLTQTGEEFFEKFLKNEPTKSTSK